MMNPVKKAIIEKSTFTNERLTVQIRYWKSCDQNKDTGLLSNR